MTKPLAATLNLLTDQSAGFARDAEISAQLRDTLKTHWTRLDTGWISYARGGIDAAFDAAVFELYRKHTLLLELSQALDACAATLVDADQRAGALFRNTQANAGSGKVNAPVKPAPAFSLPATGRVGTGPAPMDTPPGVKLSSKEAVVIPELCGEGACMLVTASASYSLSPKDMPVTLAFSGDIKDARLELNLGQIGSVPLGTLQVGMNGFEYAATAYTVTLSGYGDAIMKVTPIAGRKTPPAPHGNGQQAQFGGAKVEVIVTDRLTGAVQKVAVTIRGYVYDETQTKPGKPSYQPGVLPQQPKRRPLPIPGGSNGGSGGTSGGGIIVVPGGPVIVDRGPSGPQPLPPGIAPR